jgi:hypothetical protein
MDDMTVCLVMLLKEVFNFYMLLRGSSAVKQKSGHSSMACYVHVLQYNAAEHVYFLTLLNICNEAKISNDFNLYMLLCSVKDFKKCFRI